MGYYASGIGTIELDSGCDRDVIKTRIQRLKSDYPEIEITLFKDHGRPCLDVRDSDSHWDEQGIKSVFIAFHGDTIGGDMYYDGEDGAHWRYVYNEDCDGFNYQDGKVVYDGSLGDIPDQELIDELIRRGYPIGDKNA